MALDALILDLDGTLIDTNAVHVEAWRRVFEARGYRVAADRIFVEVGKGGDQLVPSLLGREADERDGGAMRKAHPKAFAELARKEGLHPFADVPELLADTRRRGLRTVLATSSGGEHLETIERASGLRVRDLVDAFTTSDDAENSKPAPDLVAAAAEKLGLHPAQCAMVGDTPWDAEACRLAGVVCLGLTCGGNDADTLMDAGCRAVWTNPSDLLANLDEALRIASPGRAHLTPHRLESLMRQALAAAEEGMRRGEAPIGCVLCAGDGVPIAAGHNEQNRTANPTAHAEIVAFAKAAGKLPRGARDLILVSTLEPCVMCTGAAMECAVDAIVYGLRAPADSGTGRLRPPRSPDNQMPRIVGDILPGESRRLLQRWLDANRGTDQAKYVEQLLAITAPGT